MNVADDLKARGLVEHTSTDIETILGKTRTVYIGADPTADSLHVGHLVWILLMRRLGEAGHKLVMLVGGGTGMIGDPKEKGERHLLDEKTTAKNTRAIQKQLAGLFGKTPFRMVNNADWLMKTNLIAFLRDVGKYFTVNDLIKRETIKRRLENPDDSISYTEFTYALLQGFDYYTLNKKYGVDLQIGGTDQWTNLLSGIDLIKKREGKEAYVITFPLVTDANGKKFGKSEGNAVWLDAKKTSPFDFYQFWFNQPDDVVSKYLKFYTFMSLAEVDLLMEEHQKNPGKRLAQGTLAKEVTEIVHGKNMATAVTAAVGALFGEKTLSDLNPEARAIVLKNAPTLAVTLGMSIVDVLTESTLAASKSEARRLIEGKGISIQSTPVENIERTLKAEDFTNKLAVLKKGKKDLLILILK